MVDKEPDFSGSLHDQPKDNGDTNSDHIVLPSDQSLRQMIRKWEQHAQERLIKETIEETIESHE